MASVAASVRNQDPSRFGVWGPLALIVGLMWAVHFVLLNGLVAARDWHSMVASLPLRTINLASGLGISLLVVAIHAASARARLWRRFGATLLAAIIACAVHALISRYILIWWSGQPSAFETREFLLAASERMWFYTSLSATVLALSYSISLRERTQSLRDMEAKVHGAQVQALRYQLNPHFLFNTLNAIAALVGRKQHRAAEVMIENLSDFLRAGLAIDPHEDVTLARELLLLSLYLDIESQRFPGRLAVEIDVPPHLKTALVPSLITQPLAESAVRRSAARSTVQVCVRIAAWSEDGQLRLLVSNGAGDCQAGQCDQADAALAAVEERLRARFGAGCSFESGRDGSGGFKVELAIPLSDGAAAPATTQRRVREAAPS